MLLITVIYYNVLSEKRRECFNNKESSKEYTTHKETNEISKVPNFSRIFRPDDILPLYQNYGNDLPIPANIIERKQRARSQSMQRIEKAKKYCNEAMPHNFYLRLANEHVEDTNKRLYYDFYYGFLYCQTNKVIHFYAQHMLWNIFHRFWMN